MKSKTRWMVPMCALVVVVLLATWGCGTEGDARHFSSSEKLVSHSDSASSGVAVAHRGGEKPLPSSRRHRKRHASIESDKTAKRKSGYPVREKKREDRNDPEIQSGLLTGGSLDDLANIKAYHDLIRQVRWNESQARDFLDQPLVITVQNVKGQPLGGVDLVIDGAQRWTSIRGRTKSNGQLVLMRDWDHIRNKPLKVKAIAPGMQQPVLSTIYPAQANTHTITLQHKAAAPKQLDLAFVVDCTGSMSDELEYLKAEVESITQAVAKRFPHVTQRYALVAYRDRGDEYVTRSYDFGASGESGLRTFRRNLKQQSASGGGDYPEAVHRALAKAGKLSWAKGNISRVCFHIADAPPHHSRIEDTFDEVDTLRAQGVAIYPVASSGVKELAEFTMRTEALLTGSEYLFLTDDSGVGNAHETPTADRFEVETLKELMIRMIAQELAGLKFGPREGEVLRTAWGKDPSGRRQK